MSYDNHIIFITVTVIANKPYKCPQTFHVPQIFHITQ